MQHFYKQRQALKIIDILHARYHLKLVGHIQKKINKRTSVSVFMRLYDNHNENEDENKK